MQARTIPSQGGGQRRSMIDGSLKLMGLLLIGIALEGVGRGLAEAAAGLWLQLASPTNAGGDWGVAARVLNAVAAWIIAGLQYGEISRSLWCVVDVVLCLVGAAVVAGRPRPLWRRAATSMGGI